MEGNYNVGLQTRSPLDLASLEAEFRSGYIHHLGSFIPEELFVGGGNLFTQTKSGHPIKFIPTGFRFYYDGPLNEPIIMSAIKSAIELGKKLQSPTLIFSPNFLSLYLGHFNGEEAFEREFGPIAGTLQRRLFLGGNVGYAQSSNDFSLYLGTDQEIGGKRGGEVVKKIIFEGTAQSAASLDELLARIEQHR